MGVVRVAVLLAASGVISCDATGTEPVGLDGDWLVVHDEAVSDVEVTVVSEEFGSEWAVRITAPTAVPLYDVFVIQLSQMDCPGRRDFYNDVNFTGTIVYRNVNQLRNLAGLYSPWTACFTEDAPPAPSPAPCDHRAEGDIRVEVDDAELRIRFTDVVFTCHPEDFTMPYPMIESVSLDGLYTAPLEPM